MTDAGLQARALGGGGEPEQLKNEYGETLGPGDRYTSSSGCVPGDRFVANVSQTPSVDKASDNAALILGGAAISGVLLLGLIAVLLLRRGRRRERVAP